MTPPMALQMAPPMALPMAPKRCCKWCLERRLKMAFPKAPERRQNGGWGTRWMAPEQCLVWRLKRCLKCTWSAPETAPLTDIGWPLNGLWTPIRRPATLPSIPFFIILLAQILYCFPDLSFVFLKIVFGENGIRTSLWYQLLFNFDLHYHQQ